MIADYIPLLKPIYKKLKKYRVEIFLLSAALAISLISIIIFIIGGKVSIAEEPEAFDAITDYKPAKKYTVEIAGSVSKPDVYEVSRGARLVDILRLSGGLSTDADVSYFHRNFNLAKFILDQEKIYVPSVYEIQSGIFSEPQRSLDYLSAVVPDYSGTANIDSGSNSIPKVDINTADVEELDTLPGVGKATAQKIIQSRPYNSIDELVSKKAVNKNIFEKIRDLISL